MFRKYKSVIFGCNEESRNKGGLDMMDGVEIVNIEIGFSLDGGPDEGQDKTSDKRGQTAILFAEVFREFFETGEGGIQD